MKLPPAAKTIEVPELAVEEILSLCPIVIFPDVVVAVSVFVPSVCAPEKVMSPEPEISVTGVLHVLAATVIVLVSAVEPKV